MLLPDGYSDVTLTIRMKGDRQEDGVDDTDDNDFQRKTTSVKNACYDGCVNIVCVLSQLIEKETDYYYGKRSICKNVWIGECGFHYA